MNVAILARSERLYTARRLTEACRKKGLNTFLIPWKDCVVRLSSKGVRVRWANKAFPKVEGVIPYLGVSDFSQGVAILQALEAQKIPSLVPASALETSVDPWKSALALARRKCPVHPGFLALSSSKALRQASKLAPHDFWVTPLDAKNPLHPRGPAFLCENQKALPAILDAAGCLSNLSLVQAGEIPQKGGSLRRVFVVGGQAVATFELTWPKANDAAHELAHLWAPTPQVHLVPLAPDPSRDRVGVKAAQAMGAKNYASVDMLKTEPFGEVVLSVRCAPSLRDAENLGAVDLCALVAQTAKERLRH